MSQETVQPSGQQDTESSGSQDKVAYQTYQKVLSEKKKMAEKLGELEAKFQELESTKLQEQGKFKEIAEAKAKEAEEWKKKAAQIAQATASHVKENALKLKAQELGMVPKAIEKLSALVNLDEVELEDGFQVNQAKVADLMSNLQKEHDYLFKKTVAPTKDVFPGASVPFTEMKTTDMMKLKNEEFEKLVNSVFKKQN
jgi:DNA repair exonuclease SbcCD ATPase subunit